MDSYDNSTTAYNPFEEQTSSEQQFLLPDDSELYWLPHPVQENNICNLTGSTLMQARHSNTVLNILENELEDVFKNDVEIVDETIEENITYPRWILFKISEPILAFISYFAK